MNRVLELLAGTGVARYRRATPAVSEAAILVLGPVAGVGLRPDTTPHPDRFGTTVRACDLGARGSATVTFDLNNGDIDIHNYQVHLIVTAGRGTLGSGTSLVNHVAGGATGNGRILVPVTGDLRGAHCQLWADLWEGPTGHSHG